MKGVELLDCTLRDGGYVNDWDFGHSVIASTYKRLDRAGLDYIEVGFLDDRREFSIDKTIMPSTDALNKVFANIKKGGAVPVAMIDYGTCAIENVADCKDTFIDGIRVIFKKEKIDKALPFCQQIKDKGYKLFIQAVSITAYSDQEMIDYVKRVNKIKPYCFSIVDTYGLLYADTLIKYFKLIDKYLDKDIKIGYHSHNNFQLAFSNTLALLQVETDRQVVVDGTVYGMGKSAGNCPIELIALSLNQDQSRAKKYDLSQILEIIDSDIMEIYRQQYWGYKYNFYISSMQNCHPNYVDFLINKKTLSVSEINAVLANIPKENRLDYSKDLIEKLYFDYQRHTISDDEEYQKISKEIEGKKLLIMGPGYSLVKEKDKVKEFIDGFNPKIISVNFIPDTFKNDYIFISSTKRYAKLADLECLYDSECKKIATSNVATFTAPDYKLNYESLIRKDYPNPENALLLVLNFCIKLGVKEVYLAGFDGFKFGEKNYYKSTYAFGNPECFNPDRNKDVSNAIKLLSEQIKLNFITDTVYNK